MLALPMIGVGIGGWIGIGLSVLLLKGRFKFPLAALFAVGGIAAAITAIPMVFPEPAADRLLAEAERSDPAFALLMRVEPERREPILRFLREAEQRGGEVEVARELRYVAFEIMAIHGLKQIPVTSDAAADAYVTTLSEYLQSIHERDPELCYVYLMESRHGSDYGMSPELYDRMFASMRTIITEAASNPDPLTAEEEEAARDRFSELWTSLEEGPEAPDFYTAVFEGGTASTPEQRRGACLFMTRLYHRIAAQEQPMRAHIAKGFYQ